MPTNRISTKKKDLPPRRTLRRRLVLMVWRFHRWVYRLTLGRLGSRLVGMPVLLLSTTGRHTGRSHTVGLTYVSHGTSYAVIGSNGGAARHPDWVLNLRADPGATVQVRTRRTPVRARDATGGERRHLWEQAVNAFPGYAAYRTRTRRRIPVIVLEPTGRDSTFLDG